MVPFLWVVRGSRPARGLFAGFAFGFAFFATLLSWVLLFGELAWAALSLASAAYPGLFGLLAPVVWREERPVRSAFGLAALWTGTEYLRALWPVGGFTWGGVAYSQGGNGFLLPLASVTGPWGVTFVVVLVNALLLVALTGSPRWGRTGAAGRRGRAWGRAGVVGLAVGAALLPGLTRLPEPEGPALDVALIQVDVSRAEALDPVAEDLAIAADHIRLHEGLADDPPDLVVWGENALDPAASTDPATRAELARALREVGAPTIVGAITEDPDGRAFNDILLLDGRASVIGRYRKVHLVPFGEYVPFRDYLSFISAIDQVPRDLTPGRSLHPLRLGDLAVAAVSSFENSFPSLVRRVVEGEAAFLVVPTNNSSYERTAASRQHLVMSRFRAVENGRWVVHAAISGISAFVDPEGGVHERTELFEPVVARYAIRGAAGRTIYNRLGDWVPWAALAVAGALALAPRRRPAIEASAEELPDRPRALVILPTYKERRTIEDVVARLLALPERVDVLVVDDGSPDGTGETALAMSAREPRVRLIRRPRKAGLASAYVDGFGRALEEGYDLIVEMDADLSHRPEELPTLLAAARRFDLTVGSRYVPGGSVTNWRFLRRGLSRAGNRYARLALGLPVADATSGFRVLRRSVLEALLDRPIRSHGYAFQIELVYRAWQRGFAMGEVPITFSEREHGRSKISRRIILEALWLVTVWGIRDRFRPHALPSRVP